MLGHNTPEVGGQPGESKEMQLDTRTPAEKWADDTLGLSYDESRITRDTVDSAKRQLSTKGIDTQGLTAREILVKYHQTFVTPKERKD